MGPWAMPVGAFKGIAVLCILAMGLLFFIGVQPPNNYALPITLGFLAVSLVIWVAFENRRFQGPPVGDMIELRQQAIREAERAVGEQS